ncbi:MAG: hypothetical protein FWH25_02900 [Syntrophorhabdaceae bacterium]|nr:hypothetical protein [Syntrophorhabdaceae bacterium]
MGDKRGQARKTWEMLPLRGKIDAHIREDTKIAAYVAADDYRRGFSGKGSAP